MAIDVFSVWENLKAEKKLAEEKGISSVKKDVLIVDGYNTFIRCFTAIPTLNDNGMHAGGITGFLKSVGYAVKLFKPDRCVIVFDGVGGSLKRRKIYPEYKKRRKTNIRLNRISEDTTLDEENLSLKKQYERLVDYLRQLPLNVLSIDNVEADDTIAHLALDYFKDWNSIILSADKDFLQVVNEYVKVWSPTKKKLYGPEDVLNEYGVSSVNFVYFRALDGDVSDNVPGIRGCGLKTILKAFPILAGDKVDLIAIKENAQSNIGKLKVYNTIVEHWSDVERNYAIMQLSDTFLTTISQLHIKEVLDNPIKKLNRFELLKMIGQDGISNNIPNFPQWLNECFNKLDNYVRS